MTPQSTWRKQPEARTGSADADNEVAVRTVPEGDRVRAVETNAGVADPQPVDAPAADEVAGVDYLCPAIGTRHRRAHSVYWCQAK